MIPAYMFVKGINSALVQTTDSFSPLSLQMAVKKSRKISLQQGAVLRHLKKWIHLF